MAKKFIFWADMDFAGLNLPNIEGVDVKPASSPEATLPYFFSYEYNELKNELKKLNEKLDTIFENSQRKRQRSTITDANKKLDDILERMEKRSRVELPD